MIDSSLGAQLPWKPAGTRPGRCTAATSSSEAASSTPQVLSAPRRGRRRSPGARRRPRPCRPGVGTKQNSLASRPAPRRRTSVRPASRSWRSTVSPVRPSVEPDGPAVAVPPPGQPLVVARELLRALVEAVLAHPAGGQVEGEAGEGGGSLVGPVEDGGEHPRVPHHVDDDGVAVVVGVERVEDEAGVDVEPADRVARPRRGAARRCGRGSRGSSGRAATAAPSARRARPGRSSARARGLRPMIRPSSAAHERPGERAGRRRWPRRGRRSPAGRGPRRGARSGRSRASSGCRATVMSTLRRIRPVGSSTE